MMELFLFQDKTFGLKNKKGAKQQKYIKNVTQQVKYGQQSSRQVSTFYLLNAQMVCVSLIIQFSILQGFYLKSRQTLCYS